jgi:hypothetical protein
MVAPRFWRRGRENRAQPRVGGRFYESRKDGSEYEIGRLTAYEPPAVVAFTFRAPSDTTGCC